VDEREVVGGGRGRPAVESVAKKSQSQGGSLSGSQVLPRTTFSTATTT